MNLKNFILDLLFPVTCVNCGQENKNREYLCPSCFKLLKFCGRRYDLNLKFIAEIIIAGDYDDKILMKLIKLLKFNSIAKAGNILAKFLCLFWQGRAYLKNENYLVIPIPLSEHGYKRRGFNQSEIIARKFATDFGYELNLNLRKIKNTKLQSNLAEKKRIDNISNAFKWKGKNLSGKKIILFDDVITTGATINEAAKVLKIAGAKQIIALAIAKG